ncbi:hypothetical protein [Rheinheimera maricola]|uniref:Uncharacterized protein n=1 Tax=Rheinheimera maricola TaxID=2793282 RepID=A0ABS7X5K4_9GAMM|nr:hypothetical protein [Rheinheimera maricola]MBZ9610822.1 hypothetical protein [Rheinheimera maricola]
MKSIQLERFENYLVLPDHLPEQRYVICQADDANCWHILPVDLNNQLLRRLVANVEPCDQQRLHLILQGTYQELERQGNLLLLPEALLKGYNLEDRYFLKLENVSTST